MGRGNKSIEIREVVSGMMTADGQVTENKPFDVHFFVHLVQKMNRSVRNVVSS
jgi:hypothetical protein